MGLKKDSSKFKLLNDTFWKIFTKMCDENEGMACEKLGEMIAYGLVKDKDANEAKNEEKAKALFKKACDNGYQPACDFVTK